MILPILSILICVYIMSVWIAGFCMMKNNGEDYTLGQVIKHFDNTSCDFTFYRFIYGLVK